MPRGSGSPETRRQGVSRPPAQSRVRRETGLLGVGRDAAFRRPRQRACLKAGMAAKVFRGGHRMSCAIPPEMCLLACRPACPRAGGEARLGRRSKHKGAFLQAGRPAGGHAGMAPLPYQWGEWAMFMAHSPEAKKPPPATTPSVVPDKTGRPSPNRPVTCSTKGPQIPRGRVIAISRRCIQELPFPNS